MKKTTTAKVVKLTNAKYDYFPSTAGLGCFSQGAIDKACAKAGKVYVYYRHENRAETSYRVYSAEGVEPIKNSESIQKYSPIEEYDSLAEAKRSAYGAEFAALYAFVKEQIAARKAK